MVAGHHFLFSGLVFFLQDADVKISSHRRPEKWKMSARRRLQVLLEIDSRRISFAISPSFSWIVLLQPLLELQQVERLAPGTASNLHRTTPHDGRTSRYPGRPHVHRRCLA